LQSRARELGSRSLLLAASYAAADPFGKVKRMIKDLIVKLMEEANSEADHQAYCKTEMATNKQTRENKQAEIEDLMAKVEKATANSQQLAQELAELNRAVADISSEQAEATRLRGEEKTSNMKTIKDAKEAQVAVERATKILKDFYAIAAHPAFLQGRSRARLTQVAREPYTGMQTEHGNVLGFLEVVLSDFVRLEVDTAAAEDQAQESFEKFMAETNKDLAVKRTEIGHKENAKLESDDATSNFKKELDMTQEELDAATNYHENLKTDCVDNGLSYEERVEKREAEVQSLQEALQILGQEDLS
jgi:DNA repair exonuclease SbcCD ATPase subunit